MASGLIGFPRTINEKAARVVAAVVALTALAALLVPAHWLVVPLAYGFWARVLTGPRLSPLGMLASRVIAPRLGRRRTSPGRRSASRRAWARRSRPRPPSRSRSARQASSRCCSRCC